MQGIGGKGRWFGRMVDVANGPAVGGMDGLGMPQGRARSDGARQGMDYTPPQRTGAFRDAGRHTARVKLVKRAMILGSLLGTIGIALAALYNPFKHLPSGVSLAGVGMKGTTITMDRPKISGVQQGGGPYEIKARAGLQDITTPSVMELEGVDAHVGMADATTTHITADHGIYNSKADTVSLAGAVRIANTSGYTLNLRSAVMSFRAGLFTSHERLRVELRGGEVSADDLAISNNGHVIAFRGNIASRFEPPAEDAPADDAARAEAWSSPPTRQAKAETP